MTESLISSEGIYKRNPRIISEIIQGEVLGKLPKRIIHGFSEEILKGMPEGKPEYF